MIIGILIKQIMTFFIYPFSFLKRYGILYFCEVIYLSQNKRTSHARTPAKRKGTRRGRGFAIFGTVFLSLIGIVMLGISGLFWYFQYDRNTALDALNDTELGISNNTLSEDIINIALFGIDARNFKNARANSDSIMILSVDTVHHAIKVTSILRDSLVPVEGHHVQKINAAYAFGGPELAIKTINQAFDLNIRDYATVNFAGMAEIIDAMGGIEVDVNEAERNNANVHLKWMAIESGTKNTPITKSGLQTLNGIQAVAFARIRKVSTNDAVPDDFGRTDRQRYVMEQLFNKALSLGKSKYPGLIKSLLPYTETSLTYSDILDLAGVLTGDIHFEQLRMPDNYSMTISTKDYPGGLGSVVYYNLDYATEMMHAFIYDDVQQKDFIAANPIDRTPWYTAWAASH